MKLVNNNKCIGLRYASLQKRMRLPYNIVPYHLRNKKELSIRANHINLQENIRIDKYKGIYLHCVVYTFYHIIF